MSAAQHLVRADAPTIKCQAQTSACAPLNLTAMLPVSGSAPTIKASVTFLTREEGGRSKPPIGSKTYRPHLVVGDPHQRVALTASDGRSIEEEYLGVQFTGSVDDLLVAGRSHAVVLELVYYPSVDYAALTTGAEFTIREGGTIVGYGRVTDSHDLRAT